MNIGVKAAEHYNYFRDYDSAIGRYVESDPIGLKGGANSFSYVRSNALTRVDPKGLYGTTSPNPASNTVICDGDGDVIPQIAPGQDLSCGLGKCIEVHENHHINDLKKGGGGGVCKGKPKGMIVTFPECKTHRSEMGASGAEIVCLQASLDGADCGCKKRINKRIDDMRDYQRDHFDRWLGKCDLYEAFP
jgi:hypothetical protein